MQNQYPIVILPDFLLRISTIFPPLPKIPLEPANPKLKEPKEPIKPSKPTTIAQAWGCGILTIGIFVLIIYIARTSNFMGKALEGISFPFDLIFLAAPFIAIYFIYSITKNAGKENNEYNNKLKQYEKEFKQYEFEKLNYKSKYEEELNDYNTIKYPNYINAIQLFENEKEVILSDAYIQKYRQNQIVDFFKNTIKPVEIENKYLTGVSEEMFFNFLLDKSDKFIKDYSIIENLSVERYYVPDIIYYNHKTGILIDIEIDEPYLGSDGSPIHYIGFDNKRNKFFKKNGWVVIRFAEEQVIKYPEQCYLFINNIINSINDCNFKLNFDFINLIPQWTKEDANKMAFARTRNKYLNRKLVEKISEEIFIETRNVNEEKDDYDDLPF